MAELPIRDRVGNALLDFRAVTEEELARVAVPASLVVVTHADKVLMMFDSWRREWELPGGTREPGAAPGCASADHERRGTGVPPAEPVSEDMSPLDAEIARRVLDVADGSRVGRGQHDVEGDV
jgi:hypothetical protein